MEILKPGNKNKIIDCYYCNAKLEYSPSDEKYYSPQLNMWNRYIDCPCCGAIIKTRDYNQELKEIKKEIKNNKED